MTTLGLPNLAYAVAKRTLEMVVSATAIMLLTPLPVAVALAVKAECPEISFSRNTSLRRELGILIRTVPVLIRRTGVA